MMFISAIRNFKMAFTAIALCSLVSLPVHGANSCEAIFVATLQALSQNESLVFGLEKLQKNLGREVIVIKLPFLNEIALVDSSNGKRMGEMEIVIHENVLVVMGLNVKPAYRRQGVSEALLDVALNSGEQAIEVISTTVLTQDNALVLSSYRQQGWSLERAILETPAYLIRAKFGFTELVPGSITENSFNVRRPRN